jgi:glycosyltransferase involved in cell wall biosynthesis
VLQRARVPFGVQADENLDRDLHPVARFAQPRTLRRASFVACRSPRASELLARSYPDVRRALVPHPVPGWEQPDEQPKPVFTVGYAGRLVPEKGLGDLVDAFTRLRFEAKLLLVGNGPMKDELEGRLRGTRFEILTDVTHEEMASAYARMDVLVLPSRTTATWAEQFGRVLVEALWCGVPVIGSNSGEIPWVVQVTGGGVTFPEGDVAALVDRIAALRAAPGRRLTLARHGRRRVEELFAVEAVASRLEQELCTALAAPSQSPTRADDKRPD